MPEACRGGNQQKAIIARELDRNPEIVIAVQPVRGLDVGAIEYIHKQLIEQRDAGKAVLFVSLELDEVMNVSDKGSSSCTRVRLLRSGSEEDYDRRTRTLYGRSEKGV